MISEKLHLFGVNPNMTFRVEKGITSEAISIFSLPGKRFNPAEIAAIDHLEQMFLHIGIKIITRHEVSIVLENERQIRKVIEAFEYGCSILEAKNVLEQTESKLTQGVKF